VTVQGLRRERTPAGFLSDGALRRPVRTQVVALAVSAALCFGTEAAGGALTAAAVRDWYPTLAKPAWTPPSWVFGPVWTLLFALMAASAWLVWRRSGPRGAGVALGLFGAQLVLNAGWSLLFFALCSPGAALIEINVLWVAIAATIAAFARVSRAAALLLVPYLLWVGYATALNAAVWSMNP
jgi:benzodiazapine receptor